MASKINITSLILGVTLSFAFFFCSIGEAKSFPFRSVNIGDRLPPVKVKDLRSRQDVSLSRFQDKPMLIVFFGADIPTKKKRSIKALKVVQQLLPFTSAKGIAVLVVNVQGDNAEVINEVVSATDLTAGVYVDDDRQAYSGLGIFVMPSIMLVAADGSVAAGMGYSRDLPKRLKGELEIMLGEKTRAQVEEELRPEMVVKSVAEKGAKRYFHLGMTMIERGQPEAAMRELKKAIAIESGMGRAHIHLGCLQLDEGKVTEAKISLVKGLELEPDSTAGQICSARVKALEGNLDEAIDDLGFMMLRNSRNNSLHYVLGSMLEEKADIPGAMKEYRKAYELLEKKFHAK